MVVEVSVALWVSEVVVVPVMVCVVDSVVTVTVTVVPVSVTAVVLVPVSVVVKVMWVWVVVLVRVVDSSNSTREQPVHHNLPLHCSRMVPHFDQSSNPRGSPSARQIPTALVKKCSGIWHATVRSLLPLYVTLSPLLTERPHTVAVAEIAA
jgi:hypothetical protein